MKSRWLFAILLVSFLLWNGCSEEELKEQITDKFGNIEPEDGFLDISKIPILTASPTPTEMSADTTIPTNEPTSEPISTNTPIPVMYQFSVEPVVEGATMEVPENGLYEAGSEIKVVVYPESGYTFQGWYKGEELVYSMQYYKFKLTEDTCLTARIISPTPKPSPTPDPKTPVYELCQTSNPLDALESEELKNAGIGTIVTFGAYEQDNNKENGTEPIEWLVLDIQEGQLLLLSCYVLDARRFHSDDTKITWENCELRQWMNADFYQDAFSDEEKEYVKLTQNENPDNSFYGTSGGNDTKDYVFLLSEEEVNKYFKEGYFGRAEFCIDGNRNKILAARPTAYAFAKGAYSSYGVYGEIEWCGDCTWYYLRTPGANGQRVSEIHATSDIYTYGTSLTGNTYLRRPSGEFIQVVEGMRPAIWVQLPNSAE